MSPVGSSKVINHPLEELGHDSLLGWPFHIHLTVDVFDENMFTLLDTDEVLYIPPVMLLEKDILKL